MDTKVTAFAGSPDASFGNSSQAPAPAPEIPEAPATPGLDLRLVIEQDQGTGSFVYKTVNRRTGEVVQSLPRADLLKLREEAAYMAGSLIRTEA